MGRREVLASGVAALVVAGLMATGGALSGSAHAVPGEPWSGGWEAAMTAGGPAVSGRTIRMVVHTTAGGRHLRLRLSNRYGTRPLVIGAVEVAARASGPDAVAGTARRATFDGRADTLIPTGGHTVTDPVALPASADEDLLVSVYLPGATGALTAHADAEDTSYLSTPGDHTADPGGGAFPERTGSWYVLCGLDVLAPGTRGTLVAFGDSLTDGYRSTPGGNDRWPDDLARRLAARPGGSGLGVVNAGIGGNRVLTDAPRTQLGFGVSALHRFLRDALGEPRVRTVILLEGINDIGNDAGPGGTQLTARQLIDGYRQLIAEAHRAHVRIIGGTLLPFQGADYWSARGEATREAVNRWMLSSRAFDATVDFAAAVADPGDPRRLRPGYDSGDHLHLDPAGYQALADAVNLTDLD
jgi:lysophospholipase L1-like esterase